MSDTLNQRLARGEIVDVGGKLYVRCGECGSVIRMNKPILGSLHLCLTEEERVAKRAAGR